MPLHRRLPIGRAAAGAAGVLFLAARIAGADQTVQVGPGNTFSPANVSVAPGEAVIWNFNELHTSTSDTSTGPEVWDSGLRSSGTFSHTFNTPGSYPYYCQLHSFPGGTLMNGVVQVLGGATATPTPTVSSATATPTVATPTATPTLTAVTATATPSTPVPTVTPTVPIAATATATVTATPIGTPSGGVPTTTPLGEAAAIPALDARGRAIAVLALALAGVAAIFLARRG